MTLKECLIEALTTGRKFRHPTWAKNQVIYWDATAQCFMGIPNKLPVDLSALPDYGRSWELVPEPKKYEIWVPLYLEGCSLAVGNEQNSEECAREVGVRNSSAYHHFVGVRKIEYTEGEEV